MPISPRLDRRLYFKILNLVNNADRFIFFGTYSVSVDYGVVKRILERKQSRRSLMVACLLPPPTDYVLWDRYLRREFIRAYGLSYTAGPELSEAVANDPQPAFRILERVWGRSSTSSRGYMSRLRYYSVIRHIETIGSLYRAGVSTFLEPNTHAKFVVSESDIYEGSGNLTRYGLEVNVEVYNFYPAWRSRRVYEYAWRSYQEFLIDYLSRLIDWKIGENYLRYAQQLGSVVASIVSSLGIRFNPEITRDKISHISKVRVEISTLRSNVWLLSGHVEVSKFDFLIIHVRR